jgi:hypothetical protein
MAKLDRKRILLLVVAVIFLIVASSIWWFRLREDFTWTPWKTGWVIFGIALVVFNLMVFRKSKTPTEGGDADEADQT